MMAAIRPALAVAKEEVAMITTEVAGSAGRVASPMRSVGEVVAKEEGSVLSSHLQAIKQLPHSVHPTPPTTLPTTLTTTTTTTTTLTETTLTNPIGNSKILSELISTTTKTSESSAQPLREVLSNALQTGLEEQVDKGAEMAGALGNLGNINLGAVGGETGIAGV